MICINKQISAFFKQFYDLLLKYGLVGFYVGYIFFIGFVLSKILWRVDLPTIDNQGNNPLITQEIFIQAASILSLNGIIIWYLFKKRKMAYFVLSIVVFINLLSADIFIDRVIIGVFLCIVGLNYHNFKILNPRLGVEKRLAIIILSICAYISFILSIFWYFKFNIESEEFFKNPIVNIMINYLSNLFDPSNSTNLSNIYNPVNQASVIALAVVEYFGLAVQAIVLFSLFYSKHTYISSSNWYSSSQIKLDLINKDDDSLATFKVVQPLICFAEQDNKLYYKENNHTFLVLGDPFSNSSIEPNVKYIKDFKDFAHSQGSLTCFFQTTDRYIENYRLANYIPILFGEEAFIDLSNFDLKNSASKNLRYSYNKIQRNNLEVDIVPFDEITPNREVAFEQILESWLSTKKQLKTGFTSGYWKPANNVPGYLFFLKHPDDGYIAVLTFLPYSKEKTRVLLDYMITSKKAYSGAIDTLMTFALMYFKDNGFEEVSLGVAAVENINLSRILSVLPTGYSFSGIRKFKEKFYPQWEKRYIMVEGLETLPQITSTISSLFY